MNEPRTSNGRFAKGAGLRPRTEDGKERCPGCGVFKAPSDFNRNRTLVTGVSTYCKECKQTRDRRAAGERRRADPIGEWARQAFVAARRRARLRDIPFSVTKQDFVEAARDICPALGIPLDYLTRDGLGEQNGPRPNSPTVDRVIGELGYVPGNIVVISFKANRIKNDSTPDELEAVASFVRAVTPPDHAQEDNHGNP